MNIIYPYRNRDIKRVKNSLDSLARQSSSEFKVFFVDYGSSNSFSYAVKELCSNYNFVNYKYYHTQFQPWNKSRALNSVIKNLKEGYCFVADIDMIFHPDFIEKAIQLQKPEKTFYFQVGFLGSAHKVDGKSFDEFSNFRKSTSEATGLSMFPVKVLKELRGFDEFFHFWGAEDTDIHVRLKNAGYEVEFYDDEILMLHQWHPSYRSKESKNLTEEFQISNIVQLNHQHLKFAKQNNFSKVNIKGWGNVISEADMQYLQNPTLLFELSNEQHHVDDLLYGQLPNLKNEILKVVIRRDRFHNSVMYNLRKYTGKKVPKYYTLKEVNDKVLTHLISFYRTYPYQYKFIKEITEIEFRISL